MVKVQIFCKNFITRFNCNINATRITGFSKFNFDFDKMNPHLGGGFVFFYPPLALKMFIDSWL